MVTSLVQIVIIGIWSAMLILHTRRLLRLAQASVLRPRESRHIREHLSRVWWWLGREEFWRNVQNDCMRCMQITFMLFLIAWGIQV